MTDEPEPQQPGSSPSPASAAGPPAQDAASPYAVGAFFGLALVLTGAVVAYTMFGAGDRARGSAVEGVQEWEGLSDRKSVV